MCKHVNVLIFLNVVTWESFGDVLCLFTFWYDLQIITLTYLHVQSSVFGESTIRFNRIIGESYNLSYLPIGVLAFSTL